MALEDVGFSTKFKSRSQNDNLFFILLILFIGLKLRSICEKNLFNSLHMKYSGFSFDKIFLHSTYSIL